MLTDPLRTSVAQMVARVVAQRVTSQDELPDLICNIHEALCRLGGEDEPEFTARADDADDGEPEAPRLRRRSRVRAPEPEPVEAAPPPAPRLLRRADVMPPAGPVEPAALVVVPGGTVRGIVKWFDPRTRRAALQLPGTSGDVPVEATLLEEMAIPRLYKGQEIEATLSTGEAARVTRLALPGGAWQVSAAGGVVRGRQSRPVVVELKREALRRAAARAEAELILGPGRDR